jgi:peroxiredoxin
MKKLSVLVITLVFALIHANAQTYNITGKLTGFKSNLQVQMTDENDNTLNTALLNRGMFVLKGKLKDGPQYVNLVITDGDDDYRCTVFAGGGPIVVKGTKTQFPYNLHITGPAEQTKYNTYQNLLKKYNLQREVLMKSLSAVNKRGDTAASNKIVRQYNGISRFTDAITLKDIFNHTDTYYAARETLDFQHSLSKDSLNMFYAALSPAVKQSIYGKRIKLSLQPIVKVGDPIFDFTALDQHGNSQKLSDLKGKYILLDFSSIYCGPCNESIEELRLISQKYKDRVQVVTFSTDPKKDWLKGIKSDNITWLTLNDGRGSYSEPILRYGVDGVPNFVIISPNGIVVDKWASYGKVESGMGELEQRIIAQIGK